MHTRFRMNTVTSLLLISGCVGCATTHDHGSQHPRASIVVPVAETEPTVSVDDAADDPARPHPGPGVPPSGS